MPSVLMNQEHREQYRPGNEMMRLLIAARRAVLANKLRPVIRQHKKHTEYNLEQAFALYLNALQVQMVAPGLEIALADTMDSHAMVPLYLAWEEAYRPEWAKLAEGSTLRRRREDKPVATDETLLWLLRHLWQSRPAYAVSAFKPEHEARVQHCVIPDELIAKHKAAVTSG